MKLGIILPVCEESFIYANKMGLDFVEFDINGSDKGKHLKNLKKKSQSGSTNMG